MERRWVVYVCDAPIHDGLLTFEEAQILFERWLIMYDNVVMEEEITDVVQ